MRKMIPIFLVIILAVSVLTACENGADKDVTGVRKDVIISVNAAINDLDPVNWYTGNQSQVFQNVYSTLVDVISKDSGQVELRPNVASSWETENEGKTWVFYLNQNAVYSNGDKVTAEFVKDCVERHRTNPYTMSYVSMIDTIEVRDEHTVAFNLHGPWASAPHCWYMVAIFHPEFYDADKEAYCVNPVGSGPYELANIDEAAGTYTLKKKADWWGDVSPSIETVTVKTITDTSTMLVALEAKQTDFGIISGSYLSVVENNKDLVLKENISIAGLQLFMNPNREPLNNKLLRQAIGYAMNYPALENSITGGFVASKSNSVKFATLDYEVAEDQIKYYYAPDKAKELIAQSGLSVPIHVGNIYGGNSNGAAEIVQQCLSEVGIEAKIVQLEGNTMAQAFFNGDFDVGITSSPGYVSAAETMMGLYKSGETYNFSQFSNQRVDELIEIMMTTQDKEEYDSSVAEALNIIIEECTTLGIGIPASYSVGNADLHFDPAWSGLDMLTAKWVK